MDDRSLAWRRMVGAHFAAVARATAKTKFTFGARSLAISRDISLRSKISLSAPKPKVKRERTDATRAYFREYQRRRRAEAKAFMGREDVVAG